MKNEKKGGLLDVFIVLMIMFGAVGVFLRLQMLRVADGNTEVTANVTLAAENVHVYGLECLTVGEMLYTAGGEVYGEVTEISHTPVEVEMVSGGTLFTGTPEDAERVRLTLRLTTEGRVQDGVFLREGKYALMIGERVTLYGERSALELVICQVETP